MTETSPITPLFDTRVLFDLRGLVTHAMRGGKAQATVLNDNGDPVPSAAHGVHQFIERYLKPVLEDVAPIAIIAVLEGHNHNTRRRNVLPSYKDKPEQDADDKVFIAEKEKALLAVQRIIRNLGGLLVATPYAEADDTIAYLCERLSGKKIVFTVDQDLMQLWDRDNVRLILPDRATGELVDLTNFKGMEFEEENEGFESAPPVMVRLYKSIVGDTSDNFKGVKGVADGKFADLVVEYGYDGMLQLVDIVDKKNWADLDDLVDGTAPEGKAKATKGHQALLKLRDDKESWAQCWWLAGLKPEWCESTYNGKVTKPQWSKRLPDTEKVSKDLDGLGLLDMLEDFKQYLPRQWLIDANGWNKLVKGPGMDAMLDAMDASPAIAFDYETYDALQHDDYQKAKKGGYVDVLNSELTGASFCFGANLQNAFYLPVLHRDTANASPDCIKYLLESTEAHPRRLAHHAKFEQAISLTNLDYKFPDENLPEDTLITASYVDENMEAGLKKQALHWLGYQQVNYREIVPEGKDMRDVSGAEVLSYGADDSFVCAHLYVLHRTIMECEQTFEFYQENEPFFDQALLVPFVRGVPVNWDRLAELEREDDALFIDTERELRNLLAEHCSEVNEAGFKTIAPEVVVFKAAMMKKKDKAKDEILEQSAVWIEDVREKCKYVPFAAPRVEFNLKAVSHSARSLGLPCIRSLKPAAITKWVESVLRQAETVGITDAQRYYVDLLNDCKNTVLNYIAMGACTEEDARTLHEYIEQIQAQDQTFWVGTELNAGSSLQMAMLFYGMLGLPIVVRNEVKEDDVRDQFDLEGAPSTNDTAIRTWMVMLAEDENDWRFRVLELILIIRGIRTRRQLYYKPWPLWKSPVDGNMHPQFRNCGTVTRRPSGSSPNLLQVSKHKDEGKMRSTVLPLDTAWIDGIETDEKQVIVSIDVVQQEMALLAAQSNDPTLLACYTGPRSTRRDVHSTTATTITNIYRSRKHEPHTNYAEFEKTRKDKKHPDFASSKMIRDKRAKPTNFLLIFGGGPSGLARKLIVPKPEAQEIFDGFYRTYAEVKPCQEAVIKFARRHGYVLGAFGTRKHLAHINSKNGSKRAQAERQAINWYMQASAAEILKKILRQYVLQKVSERTGATLYAAIYDEVLASVPVSKVYEYIKLMEPIMQLHVPNTVLTLDTSVSIGNNWGQQIELNDRKEVIDEALVNEVLEELEETE